MYVQAIADVEDQYASEARHTSPRPISRPIDLAHLSRYTLGDLDLEREILGLFADQIPRLLSELRNADSEKSWQQATHTLKGSARAIGAWGMSEAASRAENLGWDSDRASQIDAIDALETASRDVLRHIRADTYRN